MTTATRLTSLSNRLTVMERARLALRYYVRSEEPDPEPAHIIGADDPQVRRIIDAVIEANAYLYQALSYAAEWLYQEEIQLGWLRCLDAILERDATLREALARAGWSVTEGERAETDAKKQAVMLRALPEPGHGLARTLPIFWGTKAYPEEEDTEPADLGSLRDRLAFELTRTIAMRWRDCLAHRAVFAELAAALAQDVTNRQVAEALTLVEAKVLELYEGLCRRGERFPLPEDAGRQLETLRGWVQWEDLREPGVLGAPPETSPWVPPHLQEKLDALEARLAAELRGEELTSLPEQSE